MNEEATLNWPIKEKPRGSSLKGRKVEIVALFHFHRQAWR